MEQALTGVGHGGKKGYAGWGRQAGIQGGAGWQAHTDTTFRRAEKTNR